MASRVAIGERQRAAEKTAEDDGVVGLELDPGLNARHGRDAQGRITRGFRPQAVVVPTNEELMIAMDTAEIAAGASR